MLRPCWHPFLSLAVPTHTLGRDKAARQAADRELLEWQQQGAARLGPRWPQNAKRAARPSFGRLWVHALEQATRDDHLPEHARAAASHLVSSLIMNPDAAVVLKHPSMELKRMFLGWLHTTLAEI